MGDRVFGDEGVKDLCITLAPTLPLVMHTNVPFWAWWFAGGVCVFVYACMYVCVCVFVRQKDILSECDCAIHVLYVQVTAKIKETPK
jgi:hypothetical protein